MADSAGPVARLLGFAPRAGIADLHAALAAVDGPEVAVRRAPAGGPNGIAALLQPEPATPPDGGLRAVRRRLEVACQAGPFLAMDPEAACCPAQSLPRVLEAAWDRLAPAVAHHGGHEQWDVLLRWDSPSPRGACGAALMAALAPAVLALRPACAPAGAGELTVTVMVPRGGESAIEMALHGTAAHVAGAEITLRGPLPALSFAAPRLAPVAATEVAAAWNLLDLPERLDAPALHRHWRQRTATVAEIPAALAAAYQLLRDLMREDDAIGCTLRQLLRGSGHRLILPLSLCEQSPPPTAARKPPVAVLETLS